MQDLGRTGFRQFGVSTSGALDWFALRVANLLVGNDESAAGLEITLGGLQLRFEDDRIVAWCGGEFDVQIGSRALPAGHVAHLQTGDELKFGGAQFGCRCWLAISGGIDVPLLLVVDRLICAPISVDLKDGLCVMATSHSCSPTGVIGLH